MSRFQGAGVTAPPLRRLPVFSTVRRTFELLWIYRRMQLHLLMPALILLTVGIAMGLHKFGSIPPDKAMEAIQAIPKWYILLWLFISGIGMMLLMMFSVGWRRFLLMNIQPTTITFARPFRRYLILFMLTYFAAIFGATFIADLVLTALPPNLQTPEMLPAVSIVCVFIALAIMMILIMRYVLMFTAVTIENSALNWRDAAAFMKGNLWRVAAAWFLIVLSVNLVNNIVGLFLGILRLDPVSDIGSIVVGAVSAATMVVTTSLTASLSALTYDYLVRGGGPKAHIV